MAKGELQYLPRPAGRGDAGADRIAGFSRTGPGLDRARPVVPAGGGPGSDGEAVAAAATANDREAEHPVVDLVDEQSDDAVTGEVPVVTQSSAGLMQPGAAEEPELETEAAPEVNPGSDDRFETRLESWVSSSEPQRRW